MAVERLWEAWQSERWQRIVLDTPPTRQALDFLEAPQRIVGFLDSGALRVALRPWFDEGGRLRAASRWGAMGRGFEGWLDEVVGLDLLRDMAEFFAAFAPLFAGFRERAAARCRRCCAAPTPSSCSSPARARSATPTPCSSPAGCARPATGSARSSSTASTRGSSGAAARAGAGAERRPVAPARLARRARRARRRRAARPAAARAAAARAAAAARPSPWTCRRSPRSASRCAAPARSAARSRAPRRARRATASPCRGAAWCAIVAP